MLFDYANVGVQPNRQVADLPGGGRRTIGAKGLHGVFVNGVQVHDGVDYIELERGPGEVLSEFKASSGLAVG